MIEQIDNSPELEALLVQNQQNSEQEQALLETMVVQGEKNNPVSVIQEGNKTLEEIKEKIIDSTSIIEAMQATTNAVAELTEEVKKKDSELYLDPEEIRGEKGERGERGEKGEKGDKPLAGIDYPIPENGKDGKDGIAIDGKDGKDGVSVVSTKMESDDLIVELSDGRKINVGRVKGEDGKTPSHRWNGFRLQFEKPNGEWGDAIDLRGVPGKDGSAFIGNANSTIQIMEDGAEVLPQAVRIDFNGSGVTVTEGADRTAVVTINDTGVSESLAIAYAVAL